MARLPRVTPVDVPVHLIQRGNNRMSCFLRDEDHAAYAAWLLEYSRDNRVEIHAWVMMSNHVHLLATPRSEGGISRMMQSLGRKYVRYFNAHHDRTGTLWEGRYKSCLIEENSYLLEVYRYIELNPVRAGLVTDPVEYPWSSYRMNGEGVVSELCTPHDQYLALGVDAAARLSSYRELIRSGIADGRLADIRKSVHQGLAFGTPHFKEQMAAATGRSFGEKRRGRPIGWRKRVG